MGDRKINLDEESARRMIEESYGSRSGEEKGLLMKTLISLWGKDKPMGEDTMNNPDVMNNYMEKMFPNRHEKFDIVDRRTIPELEMEMNYCVEKEDYEGAAECRDRIKELSK